MRGRPRGSRNKNPKAEDASPDTKALRRKRHQRELENSVKLHESLTEERREAIAANPDNASFQYQDTLPKSLGKPFERVAKRLKKHR